MELESRARWVMGLPLVLGLAVSVAGCGAANSVQALYSTAESCPKDRITVTPTVRPRWLSPPAPPAPPPEIAMDPQRLRIYQKQNPVETYEGRRIFVAEGCGHSAYYMCDVPTEVPQNDGSVGILMACLPVEPPIAHIGVNFVLGSGGTLSISSVTPNSPAAAAGVTAGDLVVEVDHQTVKEIQDAVAILNSSVPSGHQIKVRRGETTIEINVASLP